MLFFLQQLFQFPCKKRILLSGTPIQNDLQEFYTLVNFVNPGVLGSLSGIKNNSTICCNSFVYQFT